MDILMRHGNKLRIFAAAYFFLFTILGIFVLIQYTEAEVPWWQALYIPVCLSLFSPGNSKLFFFAATANLVYWIGVITKFALSLSADFAPASDLRYAIIMLAIAVYVLDLALSVFLVLYARALTKLRVA